MQRSIIGNILGNLLGNILEVMPRKSLQGILRLKTEKSNVRQLMAAPDLSSFVRLQKSIVEDVPEEGDSIGKFGVTRRGSPNSHFHMAFI